MSLATAMTTLAPNATMMVRRLPPLRAARSVAAERRGAMAPGTRRRSLLTRLFDRRRGARRRSARRTRQTGVLWRRAHRRLTGSGAPGQAGSTEQEDTMADDITKRIAHFIEPFQVTPGSHVKLAKDFDPAFKGGIEKKKDGVGLLDDGIAILADYQRKLAAQATQGVVVVLQALDAAGKDGTIRHVMSGVNPQGVRVQSFKVPSAAELDQDYLRRYQEHLPARGEIGIFNRSHYEEVLVVRVHPENLVAQKLPRDAREHHVWKHRYHAINEWERYLTENGVRIVKLFLNLSKEEQRRRFLRRIDLPEHN